MTQTLSGVICAYVITGRFREGTFHDYDIAETVKQGQRLAVQVNCTVMFQDINLLTNGELVVDICTSQVGMQNIHSTVECLAALTAVVMGIVDEQGEECTIYKCAHAACMYYTAGELAIEKATVKDSALPGSLRTYFVDTLHVLEEEQIRKEAKLSVHK